MRLQFKVLTKVLYPVLVDWLYFLAFLDDTSLTYGFIPLNVVFDLQVYEIICLVFSSLPVFFVGLAEDFGYSMPPKRRLFASALSGSLVLLIFQVWITKLGIPIVDNILSFAPFAILFTLFNRGCG